jgi:hypothetical protein
VSEQEQCPRLIEVQRLWEGEIDEPLAGEVRRHLAHCSGCRAEYESWDHLSGLLARGDPAVPLLPERQRRLKEQLLARVPAQRVDAASLGAADDPERRQGVPRFGSWRGPRPVRMILALAPLAAAMLLLLVLGRHVPPSVPRSNGEQSRIGTAPPPPRLETRPRPPRKAVASGQWLVAGRDKGKNRRVPVPLLATRHPPPVTSRAVRSRPRVRLARPVARVPAPPLVRGAGPPNRPRGHSFPPKIASRPAEERRVMAPGRGRRVLAAIADSAGGRAPGLAAPKPIERLVIQADGPPVEAETITQVTISAAGDPRLPGAQLAVVRSRREEALP